MTYRIEPLAVAWFTPLFDLSDAQLLDIGAARMISDAPNGGPCRVTLSDVEPGGRMILVHHSHLNDPTSPYRASGPIFVREHAIEAQPFIDTVPAMLSSRLLSGRVYDADASMIDADVVEGYDLDARLTDWFADPAVAEIHLHTARQGCFMARAIRH